MIGYGSDEERARAAARVAAHLAGGGLVTYPTETVYGVGCALHPEALVRLAEFKSGRPFLLLVRGREDVPGLRWTKPADRLARRFWPGPLTLALTDYEERYPPAVRGPGGSVAVRVSPHPAVAALLEAAGGPVTSTSANRPGEDPARDAHAAARACESIDDVIVLDGGRLPPGAPSTIVRCADGVSLIREGAVPRSEIEAVVELR